MRGQRAFITCEDPVDGRPVHLLPGEDHDVQDVGDGAEDAHHETEVPVHLLVLVGEFPQVAEFLAHVGGRGGDVGDGGGHGAGHGGRGAEADGGRRVAAEQAAHLFLVNFQNLKKTTMG